MFYTDFIVRLPYFVRTVRMEGWSIGGGHVVFPRSINMIIPLVWVVHSRHLVIGLSCGFTAYIYVYIQIAQFSRLSEFARRTKVMCLYDRPQFGWILCSHSVRTYVNIPVGRTTLGGGALFTLNVTRLDVIMIVSLRNLSLVVWVKVIRMLSFWGSHDVVILDRWQCKSIPLNTTNP